MDFSLHTDNAGSAYLHRHHHHLQHQRQQQQLLHHQQYPQDQHRQHHYHHHLHQAQLPQALGKNFYDLESFDRTGNFTNAYGPRFAQNMHHYTLGRAPTEAAHGFDSSVYSGGTHSSLHGWAATDPHHLQSSHQSGDHHLPHGVHPSVNLGTDTMFSLGRPRLHGRAQLHPQFDSYPSSDMQAYRQSQQRAPLGVSVRTGKPPQKLLSKRKSTKDAEKKHPAGKMTDTKEMGAASNLTSENGPGWCSVCHRNCITAVALRQHLEGKVHKKQVERQKLQAELAASKQPPLEDGGNPDILKQVWTQVSLMAKASQTGNPRKKQKTAEAGKDGPSSNAVPNFEGDVTIRKRKSKTGKDLQPTVVNLNSMEEPSTPKKNVVDKLRCDLCNVECNSQTVLEIHLGGRKHAAQVKKNAKSTAASNPQENNVVSKQESSDKVV